jgi:hypothetical protein
VAASVAWASEIGGGLGSSETASRLQILVSTGLSATIAAGILWGVAAFLWAKVLPVADEAAEPA